MSQSKKLFGIEKECILFHTAKDFFEKGVEATKIAHPTTFTNRPIWLLSFPICTLSFSLELALKGFLNEAEVNKLRKKKNGHNLLVLYESITIEIQDAIENHFENCKAHNYKFFHLALNSKAQTQKSKRVSTKAKITKALEQCPEPYIDFRYLHQLNDNFHYFNFNTVIKLTHCCLAIKANQLGIEL